VFWAICNVAMSGPVDIEGGLYDHFTLEEILSDLDNWAQRLNEYASQAEKLRKLISEGRVSGVICEDLLARIGDMAELGRRDADMLRLAAIKKMKRTEIESSDLQYRKEALEVRFAMNKISREEFENSMKEATKRLEESKNKTAILENLAGVIEDLCSKIESDVTGKAAALKDRYIEEATNLASTMNGQKQGAELARAVLSQPVTCGRCGSGNPASAQYCWNCKASLYLSVVKEEAIKQDVKKQESDDTKAHLDALKLVRCPKCGSENLALAPFCYNCKARIAVLNDDGSTKPLLKS